MLTEDAVRGALRNVVDPEIGLDLVSLGMIYRIDVREDGTKVEVDMTLTTPACPAGPHIVEQARQQVWLLKEEHPGLDGVQINLVWTPFWNPSMMSEDARAELGFF